MLHLVFILLLHAGFICGDVVVSDLICFNNLHLCFLFMDHFLLFISLISVLISNCIFYDSLYSMLASWSCYDAVYFRHWKHQACVLCRQGHNYAECSQGIQFGLSNSPLHSPMSTACYFPSIWLISVLSVHIFSFFAWKAKSSFICKYFFIASISFSN